MRVRFQGLALLEILIVLIILGFLGTAAFFSYKSYSRKVYFSEVMTTADTYRESVENCVEKKGKRQGCNAGSSSIPAAIKVPKGAVASITVIDGVVTGTPVPVQGITSQDTYILTPHYDKDKNLVSWVVGGEGVKQGYHR